MADDMRRASLIGIAFLFAAAPLFAACPARAADTSALQLGMSPQYPKPGDTVTLTATNYLGSPDGMTYVWSVDGTIILQGVGEKTFSLPAGAGGDTHTVLLSVEQNGAVAGTATATVRPADVDLIWEGKTSVPPFYVGRPLPNAQSRITLLAIPHIVSGGSELPASSLIYSWQENGIPVANASGYGRSSIVATPPTFSQPFTVSVQVETTDGIGAASGSVTIAPETPRALVYEDAPLVGVRFEKTIPAAVPFSGTEMSFAAFPVFVADPSALSYQWTLDGSPFSVDPARPGDVTFRKTGSGTGTHAITFSFENPIKFLENGSASFTLAF
jgi:hypothetical protein